MRSKLAWVNLVVLGLSVLVTCAVPAKAADAKKEEGFKSIFDGKTLDGWDGDPKVWSVADGVIQGKTTKEEPVKHNTFLIWKGGEVADFEIRLEFKLVGGNSGIQYRSKASKDWVVKGYQADFDASNTFSGILYEEGGRGILVKRGEKLQIDAAGKKTVLGKTAEDQEIKDAIKKEDWNEYVVIAKGTHLTQIINGVTTIDVVDEQTGKNAASGILAFQAHAGPPMTVQFRNVRIKMADAAPAAPKADAAK